MRFLRHSLLISCILLISVYGSAQDLGSSSDLFKPSKSSSKSSAKKKSTPKRKRTATKKRTPSNSSGNLAKRSVSSADTGSTSADKENAGQDALQNSVSESPADYTAIGTNKVIVYGGASNGSYSRQFEIAIQEGNLARNQRDYLLAEEAYDRARKLDPDDSRAIYGLGNIYSDQQRWEEAERAYRHAITLEPDSAAPYIALSFVLTQPVIGLNLAERYLEAEKMSRIAVRIAPDSALAHDQLGVSMELKGDISKSTENQYRKAISLDPAFALAYSHLGRILRKNGSDEDSSVAYKKAVGLANEAPAMILVADVFQSQQNYRESERLLADALAEDPRNPTALYLLGRALTIRRSYAEAEEVLRKSVKVSPNSFVSYTLLGSLYLRQGLLSKAESTLDDARKVISANEKRRLSQEFEEIGDGFMKKNSRQDAIRLYLKALSLDAKNKSLEIKLSQTRRG